VSSTFKAGSRRDAAQREADCAPTDLADVLEQGPPERQDAMSERMQCLLSALGAPPPQPDAASRVIAVEQALTGLGSTHIWLALAVLTARLPDVPTVQRTVRAARLDGPAAALFAALVDGGHLDATIWPAVEVIAGRVLVDLHHTARNLFNTGIQRVARETARRWARDHDVVLIGWTRHYAGYRRLSPNECHAALHGLVENGVVESPTSRVPPGTSVVVPWECTVVVPELPAEPERAARYQAFASFSGSTTGLIGFDCVPVMAAETSAEGMPAVFARYLAAASCVDRIATISKAAGAEYEGWRTMLAGAGRSGPDIRPISLPVYANTPSDAAVRQVRDLVGLGPLPVVLAVGSHEPRKNHLAVLHAAEELWREGILFTLAFVGGNSWNSAAFSDQVESLLSANRPVQTILALPDDLLWAAYRLAHCTIFPSLHEGFGLPVAESLASGTPVITSDFGSMREIAGQGGALLVDPRDDTALTDALRELLVDRPLRDRLAAEAAGLPTRSWDEYAAETWDYLVGTENVSPDQ